MFCQKFKSQMSLGSLGPGAVWLSEEERPLVGDISRNPTSAQLINWRMSELWIQVYRQQPNRNTNRCTYIFVLRKVLGIWQYLQSLVFYPQYYSTRPSPNLFFNTLIDIYDNTVISSSSFIILSTLILTGTMLKVKYFKMSKLMITVFDKAYLYQRIEFNRLLTDWRAHWINICIFQSPGEKYKSHLNTACKV